MKTVWIAVAVIAAFGAGLYIFSASQKSSEIKREMVNALALCASSPQVGAAKIRALRTAYGDGSIPKEMTLDASLCEMEGSTQDYLDIKARANTLQGN